MPDAGRDARAGTTRPAAGIGRCHRRSGASGLGRPQCASPTTVPRRGSSGGGCGSAVRRGTTIEGREDRFEELTQGDEALRTLYDARPWARPVR